MIRDTFSFVRYIQVVSVLPDPDGLADLDDRERRIYRRFLTKVGEGPAAFFLDACRMMHAQPRPVAASHLVGHSIREIESALRALLVPLAQRSTSAKENLRLRQIREMIAVSDIDEFGPDAEWWFRVAEEKGGETQREQIDAVLAELGVASTDPIATAWYRLSGAAKAHRPGLRVRPVDQEFEQYWDDTVALFDALLERLEHRFLAYIDTLDELLAITNPTRDEVARLDERVPRNLTTYKYFFERLEAPQWFAPLRRKKFFQEPFAWYWPPAVYLRKIAGRFPSDVLSVVTGIETDSPLTHAEFADAAVAMPIADTATWARNEIPWITRQKRVGWLLPEVYGKVAARLAENGETETALALAEALLGDSDEAPSTVGSIVTEAPSKVEWYELETFMKRLTPALARSPHQSLPRLVALLAKILSSGRPTEGWDGSFYWRASIAQDRGLTPGRRNELVTAIRTIATEALRAARIAMPEVLAILDAQPDPVFGRMSRFLLSQFPAEIGERIARELTDIDILLNEERGEHRLLARAGFPHLDAAAQATFIAGVNAGPDINEFRERVTNIRGTAPTDEQVEAYRLRWQTSIGQLIADTADEAFRAAHAERMAALAVIDAARNAVTVPLRSSTELRDLPIEELVPYIRAYVAAASPERRREEELGLHVQHAVAADPEWFSACAPAFKDLPPTFASRLIAGVTDSLKNTMAVHWEPLLDLIDFAIAQPAEDEPEHRLEQTWTWTWTRQHIAWLFDRLFQAEKIEIPPAIAPRLGRAVLSLLETAPNDETLYPPQENSVADRAVMRAMNSVRGPALEAAAQFVLWTLDAAPEETDPGRQRLLATAEKLLDATSPALRAAFGRAFGWLLQIDEEWVRRNLGRMFPDPTTDPEGAEMAFGGFVGHWFSSARFLELLRPWYAFAIERIRDDATFARSATADHVAHHLAALYWRGNIPIDDPLLAAFFTHAPGKLRGRFHWMIANHLDALGGVVDDDVQQRLDELWNLRIAEGAARDDRADEFSWFAYYYQAHRADARWATEALKRLLQTGVPLGDHRVIEKLARFSTDDPVLAFECYALLLALDRRERILLYEERGRDILRAALSSPAGRDARDLIHELASEGEFRFRDLLNQDEDGEPAEPPAPVAADPQ